MASKFKVGDYVVFNDPSYTRYGHRAGAVYHIQSVHNNLSRASKDTYLEFTNQLPGVFAHSVIHIGKAENLTELEKIIFIILTVK